MHKLITSFLLLFFLLALPPYTIAQPNAAIENPIRVYKTALRKLKKGKAVEKQKILLTASLNELIKSAAQMRAQYASPANLKTQEKAFPILKKLIRQIGNAEPYLAGSFAEQKTKLEVEQKSLRESLGLAYYEKGNNEFEQAKERKDKYLAQAAHANYNSAKRFNHPAADLNKLLTETMQFGKLLYIVTASAAFDINYNWDIDRQFDDLTSSSNKFLKILYDQSAVNPDCTIDIAFNSLDIDLDEDKNTEEYKKEIVVGQETFTNDDGEEVTIDKTEEISGSVTTNKITKTASWKARVDITANTKNCRLRGFEVEEQSTSETIKCETNGDARAIPQQFKNPFVEDLKRDDDLAKELISALYARVCKDLF